MLQLDPQGLEHFAGQRRVVGAGVYLQLYLLEVLSVGVSHFYFRDYCSHLYILLRLPVISGVAFVAI